jgi:hypothetical protein
MLKFRATRQGIAVDEAASYVADGEASFGVVVGDGVIDIALTDGKFEFAPGAGGNALDDISRLLRPR